MTDDSRWREAGDRIQTLLDAVSSPGAGGTATRERAEQIVREVAGLYGAALERMIGLSDAQTVQRYAADDLVASLLLVHGLHPHDVRRRVSDALDKVRPYLGSHGGDVELLGVTADLVVTLRLAGNCKSCPSSAATLELAVEDAVRSAAPEIAGFDVVTEPAAAALITADSLWGRVRSSSVTQWHPVPGVAALTPGEVGGFDVAGVRILACRVRDALYAYRDLCPHCVDTLAGAVLDQADAEHPLLRCPRCDIAFDVVRAGAGLNGTGDHLEPMPLLLREDQLCLAIPNQPTTQPTEVRA